jgi:hypothetical protein
MKPGTVVLVLVLSACSGSGSSHDEGDIWKGNSVRIAFELNGPTGGLICGFSATRQDLTATQLDGLASLRLHDSAVTSGCDWLSYDVTITAADGSSTSYWATMVGCSSSPILLFEDFDAWARTTPCSRQSWMP